MKKTFTLLFLLFLTIGNTNAQSVDGGNQHTIILAKNGTVWTIGKNEFGELGDSTFERKIYPIQVKALPKVKNVSRGYKHSIAVDIDGNVWTWGWNNYGQLSAELPANYNYPQKVESISNVVAVEGGHWHTIALKEDGTVWSWGHNILRRTREWKSRTFRNSSTSRWFKGHYTNCVCRLLHFSNR